MSASTSRATRRASKSTIASPPSISRSINPANGLPGALAAADQNGESSSFPTDSLARRAEHRDRLESDAAIQKPCCAPDTRAAIRRSRFIKASGALRDSQRARLSFRSNTQLQPAVPLTPRFLPPLSYPLPDLRLDAANNTIADLVDSTEREPSLSIRLVDHRARTAGIDDDIDRRKLLRRPQSAGGRRGRQSERHFPGRAGLPRSAQQSGFQSVAAALSAVPGVRTERLISSRPLSARCRIRSPRKTRFHGACR